MTEETTGDLPLTPELEPPTITDQIAAVRREIAMRQNVYPKWVASGRLKPAEAERERARMQAVHDSLERLAEIDRLAALKAQHAGPSRDYVLGYALAATGVVMMIRKGEETPSGAGLNGIGGKIHEGETPLEAMEREWREETGRAQPVNLDAFRCMGILGGRGWRVHVFATPAMSEWPPLHGEHAPDPGIITAGLSAMLARSPTARYGLDMPTAMHVCPWVPATLALAFLERTPAPGHEPRLVVSV